MSSAAAVCTANEANSSPIGDESDRNLEYEITEDEKTAIESDTGALNGSIEVPDEEDEEEEDSDSNNCSSRGTHVYEEGDVKAPLSPTTAAAAAEALAVEDEIQKLSLKQPAEHDMKAASELLLAASRAHQAVRRGAGGGGGGDDNDDTNTSAPDVHTRLWQSIQDDRKMWKARVLPEEAHQDESNDFSVSSIMPSHSHHHDPLSDEMQAAEAESKNGDDLGTPSSASPVGPEALMPQEQVEALEQLLVSSGGEQEPAEPGPEALQAAKEAGLLFARRGVFLGSLDTVDKLLTSAGKNTLDILNIESIVSVGPELVGQAVKMAHQKLLGTEDASDPGRVHLRYHHVAGLRDEDSASLLAHVLPVWRHIAVAHTQLNGSVLMVGPPGICSLLPSVAASWLLMRSNGELAVNEALQRCKSHARDRIRQCFVDQLGMLHGTAAGPSQVLAALHSLQDEAMAALRALHPQLDRAKRIACGVEEPGSDDLDMLLFQLQMDLEQVSGCKGAALEEKQRMFRVLDSCWPGN